MSRKVLATLLAATICVSLAGCAGGGATTPAGNGDSTPPEAAPSSASAAESDADSQVGGLIKVAVGSTRISWMEGELEKFKAQNPGVEVEVIEISGGSDMYAKITMMMQSGQTSPDLITEDGFMINSDAAAGYLEPLDDLIAANSDFSSFVPAIMAGAKGADGKQYGIPFSTDVQGIWYDKTLMAKAGVTVPFEPKSWADVMDAAKKIKETGGDGVIPLYLYSSKMHPEETSMRTFQLLYSGTGGELYDYSTQKWIVNKENLLLVYNFINDIYNVEKVGPPLSIASQQSVWDLFQSDMMKNGKLGMYFSGSWESGNWQEGKKYDWPESMDVWGYAKIPTVDGRAPGFTSMSGGWTWAVPANAPNKAGGMELLKFVCSKEVQLSYNLYSGDLAVREDVMADPGYTAQKISTVNEAKDILQYTHFRPSVEGYSMVTSMYTEVVESVGMGAATPEQAVATFESELKRIVGEENVTVQ